MLTSRLWRRASVPLAMTLMLASMGILATSPEAEAETVPARPAIVRGNQWHLRNTLSFGFADVVFSYGRVGDRFLMGDWDGDGTRTPGVMRGNTWYLRNSNSSGFADIVFSYGRASDIPIVGDWDGNGTDTPGVVRVTTGVPNTSGAADVVCGPGFITWFVKNSNSSGVSDSDSVYGCPGTPVAGDWDGDGDDTPGVRIEGSNSWSLNNDLDNTPDRSLAYGSASHVPIAGDWDGDGDETIGVVDRYSNWYLRNENTTGQSDVPYFKFGSWRDEVFLVSGIAPT